MAMERFGMFTFVVILVLGVLSRQYLGRALRLPYTVILMVLGALTGLLIENRRNAFELNLKSWYDMTPQVILYCFVPILVFESAFMTDTHIFSRQKWQILTLAGPGVLVASILTGGFVKAVFTDYGWDWPTVLMFGAMMSATDPVAVVALLKELGVSERLGTLIEGESLLNDGTAIVVFDVFKHALEHKPCDAEMPSSASSGAAPSSASFKCGDDDDHAADHRFLYGADARRALSGGYSADVETDCTTFRNRDARYLLKLANEIASLTREQYLGDADWKMVWRYLPVFSVETYWLRLRDGHIVLSDAEREDLASWSEAPRDVGVVQRLLRVLFPRDRRADYRIPALLHRRWVNYHREFVRRAALLNLDGGKAP
ncbi:potassium:proton antiporter [Aureococcus anophagefferens]|nr:potassium:proton antiporter [Aureococcus anophagefferens]